VSGRAAAAFRALVAAWPSTFVEPISAQLGPLTLPGSGGLVVVSVSGSGLEVSTAAVGSGEPFLSSGGGDDGGDGGGGGGGGGDEAPGVGRLNTVARG
jgi:hypothetical protein